jgi:hypothetical protein
LMDGSKFFECCTLCIKSKTSNPANWDHGKSKLSASHRHICRCRLRRQNHKTMGIRHNSINVFENLLGDRLRSLCSK